MHGVCKDLLAFDNAGGVDRAVRRASGTGSRELREWQRNVRDSERFPGTASGITSGNHEIADRRKQAATLAVH